MLPPCHVGIAPAWQGQVTASKSMRLGMQKKYFSLYFGKDVVSASYIDSDVECQVTKSLLVDHGEPAGLVVADDGTTYVGFEQYSTSLRERQRLGRGTTFYDADTLMSKMSNQAVESIRYVMAWRNRILTKILDLFDGYLTDGYSVEERWFVVCPSAWIENNGGTFDLKCLFERAGFTNVMIVPEFASAIMYMEKAYGFMRDVDSQLGVLCVDIGHDEITTTYIASGSRPSIVRWPVGTGLIEEMILAENFKGEYRTADQPFCAPEVLKAIGDEYRTNEKFGTYVLVAARKLMERYYTALAEGNDFSDIDCTEVVPLDEDMKNRLGVKFFTIYANDRMTKSIIHDRSVRSVLGEEFDDLAVEVRKELEDKSWGAGLKSFLQKTLEMCPDFAVVAQAGGNRACLIVTGGASLMPFVQDIISEVMPNATLYRSDTMYGAHGPLLFANDIVWLGDLKEKLSHVVGEAFSISKEKCRKCRGECTTGDGY